MLCPAHVHRRRSLLPLAGMHSTSRPSSTQRRSVLPRYSRTWTHTREINTILQPSAWLALCSQLLALSRPCTSQRAAAVVAGCAGQLMRVVPASFCGMLFCLRLAHMQMRGPDLPVIWCCCCVCAVLPRLHSQTRHWRWTHWSMANTKRWVSS